MAFRSLLLQAAPARDLLGTAADVSIVLVGLLALVGIFGLLFLFSRLRRVMDRLDEVVGGMKGKADPLLEKGTGIAANVEFITATVRQDVEGLNRSVQSLSARLQQASERMEERIEEFNALLEVVQGEAEEVFIDTASTVHGVRASAGELTRPRTGETEAAAPTRAESPAGD